MTAIIDFLSLADRDIRAAQAPSDRDYPTIEQVERVVSRMPASTDIEKRNRALIAFTAVTGIRDGALVSLRLPGRHDQQLEDDSSNQAAAKI